MKELYSRYSYNAPLLSMGRLFIAGILLSDLIFRFQYLEAHYSNEGVLPTPVIKTYYPFYQYYLSLHNIFDSLYSIKFLFIIHIMASLSLFIGYYTRFFTLLNFVLLLSLHRRNPVILQGGDDLLRITLFYMIFLPWGKFYSVDSWLEKKNKSPSPTNITRFSWFYLVFLFNIAFVYFFSALLKTSDEWRLTGDALYYALSLETLRTEAGNWIYPYYGLLKVGTFFVYYIQEILAPILLVLPFPKWRNLALLLIILFHSLNLIFLKVGLFPFVGMSTAVMLFHRSPAHGALSFSVSFSKKEFFAALLIFFLILRYHLATLNTPFFSITRMEDRLLNIAGLAQRWNMFSPGVKRYEGWLILRGIRKDHTEWDLIFNTPTIHYEKADKNMFYLRGDRWRKFLENYEQTTYNFIKPYFCYYLIKNWNIHHPHHPIEALNILYMKKETLSNYQFKTELENLCLCNPQVDKKVYP